MLDEWSVTFTRLADLVGTAPAHDHAAARNAATLPLRDKSVRLRSPNVIDGTPVDGPCRLVFHPLRGQFGDFQRFVGSSVEYTDGEVVVDALALDVHIEQFTELADHPSLNVIFAVGENEIGRASCRETVVR